MTLPGGTGGLALGTAGSGTGGEIMALQNQLQTAMLQGISDSQANGVVPVRGGALPSLELPDKAPGTGMEQASHSPEMQKVMAEYEAAVDPELLEMAEKYRENPNKNKTKDIKQVHNAANATLETTSETGVASLSSAESSISGQGQNFNSRISDEELLRMSPMEALLRAQTAAADRALPQRQQRLLPPSLESAEGRAWLSSLPQGKLPMFLAGEKSYDPRDLHNWGDLRELQLPMFLADESGVDFYPNAQYNEQIDRGGANYGGEMSYNENTDRLQFESYKNLLGTDAPKTFEAFRTLKYNDPTAYEELCGLYSYKKCVPEATVADYKAYKAVKATNIIGSVRVPPKPIDTAGLVFNDSHAARHGCTLGQALEYINTASCSVTRMRWDGCHTNYYSKDGAVYVADEIHKIKTVFSKNDFDPTIKAVMEVFE